MINNILKSQSVRMYKKLSVRAERVIAIAGLALLLHGCTIHKHTHINIKIMPRAKKKTETVKRFYTKYDRHEYNSPGSINTLPSLTQPGEAITIAEMLRMSARGEIPPMASAAFHGHNVDINIDVEKPSDITDIERKALELKQLTEEAAHLDRASAAESEAINGSSVADDQTAKDEASRRQEASETEHDS